MSNRKRAGLKGQASVNRGTSQVRIIGGVWRSRKLPVANVAGLRPTKDAVRETLFNWLGAKVLGAHCVDAFAGAGALGFEAASRGAASVTFVETNRVAAKQLNDNKALLNADACQVQQQTAQAFFATTPTPKDLIFLDPPFDLDILHELLPIICADWGSAHAMLYIEQSKQTGLPALPQGWVYSKQKISGDVVFGLAERID